MARDPVLRIERALDAVHVAKTKLGKLVTKLAPVGSAIGWMRGGAIQYGNVLRHGYYGTLFVRNDMSRREYWINPEHVRRVLRRVQDA